MSAIKTIQFISLPRKGNNKGAGFVFLPKKAESSFKFGEKVRVELFGNIHFFAKIAKANNRIGVYIPRSITLENNLLSKKVAVKIVKINGFYSRISLDGRIYVPQDVIKKLKIKQNDIIFVKGVENSKIVERKYLKVSVNKRKSGKKEYTVAFGRNFHKRELLFQLEKKSCDKGNKNITPILRKVLGGMHYALTNDCSLIIFNGNKVPAVINSRFQYPDIALYLGAYFADGTKKGNSWAICASTFEQTNFYWKMHRFLIKDANPEFIISYTNKNKERHNNIESRLKRIWEKKTNIKINKFRIHKSIGGKSYGKHNQYGTLIIREHRQILLDIYNGLLKILINEILSKKNKDIGMSFLCGVIEGDGCAPARKRGHISVALNRKSSDILKNIIKTIGIKSKITQEGEDKYFLKIGALEILRNFFYFKDKLFALYPKRREKLFERLKTVGAVKYLIENHEPVSWVKTWFLKNGFIDKNYKFTKNGLKLRRALKKVYGS